MSKPIRNIARVPVLDMLSVLGPYVLKRARQTVIFGTAIAEALWQVAYVFKTILISRMFWGRGHLYRNAFHFAVSLFTVITLVFSLSGRVLSTQAQGQSLQAAYGQAANVDLLQQGASIQSVLATDPLQPAIPLQEHIVRSGDSLSSLAAIYDVSADTIRWANSELVSPFGNDLVPGWKLKIPQIDGVLYRVRSGQTLDQVVAITNGNRSDIIELNSLIPPSYSLQAGQRLFVPNGTLAPSEVAVAGIPTGIFTNPLSHPSCAGYTYSRGFTGYHDGVDLAHFPPCPIRSIAAGKVTYAGWSALSGFNVRIDHGGGISSYYYHGSGEFWVKEGDRVQQGQEIMMMGSSGNSTGIHLHISLFKNKVAVNPYGFVPY